MGAFSIWHWVIVLIVVLILFGGKGKLSSIMGKIPGIREFYLNINLPVSKRDGINPELQRNLQKELLPEIEELSTLLNKDLTYWCKN